MLQKITLLLCFTIGVIHLNAQTDTIVYAECEIDTIENSDDKLLKYFMAEKEDVKQLWKFNAIAWGQLNPAIGYEFRLKGGSNIFTELTLLFNYSAYDGMQLGAIFLIDYRYYYNLKRRERLGKSTNGFSGNYFSLEANTFSASNPYYNGLNHHVPVTYWYYGNAIKPGYGIQRRIGTIGYIDVKAGMEFIITDNPSISPGEKIQPFIDIKLGLAIRSFSRK